MKKVLVTYPDRCTGCRICELRCAYHHTSEANPARSRIKVLKWEDKGLNVPLTCHQCLKCTIIDPCPVKAISRNPKTNAVVINRELCIGCRVCPFECPFGAPSMDPVANVAVNCDLCNGYPKCAEWCPVQAIEY
ncbi:MAG: 4Fe-4S dicluster domain-containing protein, partial [Thermoproteota archaeon]